MGTGRYDIEVFLILETSSLFLTQTVNPLTIENGPLKVVSSS